MNYSSRKLSCIILSVILLGYLSGCGSFKGYTITKRETIDKEIAVARAETEAKIAALKGQEEKVFRDTIATQAAREQAAADYLFKGSVVYGGLRTDAISRPTWIMGQSIQQTAAQLPAATPAAQADTFKALQTELDEAKTSAEVLKAKYEAQLGVAREEGAAKAKALAELEVKSKAIEAEKTQVLAKALTTEQTLQATKDKVQDKDLADKQKELDEAKKNQRIKMWLIGILLVAAAACGIGAAFLPIPQLKSKLIIGAAICGGAAIAIPFIEGWMVMVVVGAALLGVCAWILKNYKDEYSDATDTYRALNQAKTQNPTVFKQEVAPVLDQWHTNDATSKRIDERLKTVGDT